MKLTRRRIGQERENQKITAAFYRDMDRGLLYIDSKDHDCTKEVVDFMDFERSWRGRIMINAESDKNPFYKIVNGLVNKNEDIVCEPISVNATLLIKLINKHLTGFGRNLRAPGSTFTLEDLILNIQSGASPNEIKPELEKIKKMIDNDIRQRKEQLAKSIANNCIPFSLENNKLVPSSKKMQWLYMLLDRSNNLLNEQILDEYWEKYNYNKLESKIIKKIESLPNKKARLISQEVSRAVQEYHSIFRKDYVDSYLQEQADSEYKNGTSSKKSGTEEFLLFLKVVEQHFKKYYPVKSKHSSDKRDKSLCEERNYKFYCSYDFVKHEVNRSIINQLVSGLIQQGKLIHYFYDGKTWQKGFINSHGLSYIQVEEAFKKSLMASLSWGINRLTSFFYDGVIEETEIHSNEEGEIDDILLENKKIRRVRENFFNNLRDKSLELSKDMQERFKEKLSASFPVIVKDEKDKIGDDINKLIQLVEETRKSVAHLRHESFHYKKASLPEILKEVPVSYSEASEFFQRDIDHLYDAFREQIRSFGIVEYYPSRTITECFKICGLEFTLYSSQNSLIPSFRKIYKRGTNLYKSYKERVEYKEQIEQERKELYWYIEVSNSEPGWLAYKNMLQLIYYHAFLPDVKQNEALITSFINRTKEWNRREAKKVAIKKNNNHTNKNNDKSFKAYRYEAIPDYQGESLDDYFKILQREQIARAKEVSKGKAEHNYYIQFIQDVVVWAFGVYLERLEKYRESLQAPSLQEKKVTDALEELLPEEKEKSQFSIVCRFNKETDKNKVVASIEDKKTGNTNEEIKNRKDLLCFYLFLRLLDAKEISKLQHQFVRYRCSLKERSLPDKRKGVKEEIALLEELEELMELVRYTIPAVPELSGKVESGFDVMIKQHLKEFFEEKALRNPEVQKLYYQSDEKTPIPRKHMALLVRSAPLPLYKEIFKGFYSITERECLEFIQISKTIESCQSRLSELHKQLEKVKIKSSKHAYQKGKALSYLNDEDAMKVEEYEEIIKKVIRYKQLRSKLAFETLYKIFQIHVDINARLIGYAQDWERDMFFLLFALKYRGALHRDISVEGIFSGNVVSKFTRRNNKKDTQKNYLDIQEQDILLRLCWPNINQSLISIIKIRNPIAHLNHFTQSKKKAEYSLSNMINAVRILLYYDRKRQNSVTKTIKDLLMNEYHIKIKWIRNSSNKNNLSICKAANKPIVHLKHICKNKNCKINNKAYKPEKQAVWLCEGVQEEVYDKNILRCIDRLFAFSHGDRSVSEHRWVKS